MVSMGLSGYLTWGDIQRVVGSKPRPSKHESCRPLSDGARLARGIPPCVFVLS